MLFCEDGPLAWLKQIRWDDPDSVKRNPQSIRQESWHLEDFEKDDNEAIALNSVEEGKEVQGKHRNDLCNLNLV